MKQKTFRIEEIADYIAGWSTGEFGEVEKIGAATLKNALSQLRCDQDGIATVCEKKLKFKENEGFKNLEKRIRKSSKTK